MTLEYKPKIPSNGVGLGHSGTAPSDEVVEGITNLVKDSLSTFEERQKEGERLYELLVKALEKSNPPKT